MLTRIISAIIGVPIIILMLILRGNYLYVFAGLLSIIGMFEYYRAVKSAGYKTMDFIGYVFCAGLYILQFIYPNAEVFGKLITLMLLIVFTCEIFMRKSGVNGVIHTLFPSIYVSYLFLHIIFINRLENASVLVWLPFLTAWFTDTAAYFTGISIGKRSKRSKPFPTISPNKTIEGYIGGIVGCSILTTVFGVIIRNYGCQIEIVNFIILGIICGLASEVGDLAGSYIKRFSRIKDFGKLIPGHGGILDRFDSILFTIPIVYFYFLLIQNI